MASNQFQHDHLLSEDVEPPARRAPELSPEEDAATQMLREQWIPGMNALTWDELVVQVARHPDFSVALSELAHGDCRPLRELTKATALSMVRHHMKGRNNGCEEAKRTNHRRNHRLHSDPASR